VVLPDKTQYTFQYNSYGEVVRMTLPTGGAIGYQYAATMETCSSSNLSGCVINSENSQAVRVGIVERRLLTRYEYANGSTLSRQTNYTYATTSQYNTQVTQVEQDGSGNTLAQMQEFLTGDAWTPDVWGTAQDYYGDAGTGTHYETVTLSGSGQTLRQEYQAHAWRGCAASSWPQTGGGAEPCWWGSGLMDHDLQLCGKWTVLADGSPAPSAATLYQYDQNNNVTDSYEYDYGAGPAALSSCTVGGGWTRHVHTAYTGGTYATFNMGTPVVSAWQPGLASDRQTMNGAGTKIGEQQFAYDQQNLANESGMTGYSPSFAGVNAGRGNLTTSAGWESTNNTYPAHTYTYDIAGNAITDRDANGHTTSYGYGDSYSDGVNRNTYAHVTSATNALGMAARWKWDYWAGKVTTATDINNVNTTYSYNDPLDRMTQKVQAAGLNGFQAQTNVGYTSATDINVYRDQTNFGDGALRTETLYDRLGRSLQLASGLDRRFHKQKKCKQYLT
jgi:YD repeat-containing protein